MESSEKIETAPEKNSGGGLQKTGFVFHEIGVWLFRLRKIFMAAPVVYAAVMLARQNAARLPEMVGLNLQSTGEYAWMITRANAVNYPLIVTFFCLILMFCSRKSVLPWIISIFTLVLPWVIYLTNIYPA